MITTRPATRADIAHFYPEMGCSFRAWVAELDGVPEGIIGLSLTLPAYCLFSKFNEALRPYLKRMPILRLIKKAETVMKQGTGPVWAIAEPTEPTAPGILERLGFTLLGEIDGNDVYEWRRG